MSTFVKITDLPNFESACCTRCGGTGHYSFCTMYGTTCFKCGGAKRQLTKRGQVAANWERAQLKKPVHALQVGDKVKVPFGLGYKYRYETIQAIEPDTLQAGYLRLTLEHSVLVEPPNYCMTVLVTVARRRELRAAALDLQSTLTKTGKIRFI